MVSQAGNEIDRNELVAHLIYQLKTRLANFELQGLQDCIEDWNHYDRYYDQPINLIMGNKTLSGIGKGIDTQGGIMLLEAGSNIAKAYYGGEISLRGKV
jgi:BirA family biotin operon repressor/biotin-[acetyl-CoA-carboxylase] ligase